VAGRYRVTDELGKGGMGTVCRAVDEVLGREVAIKELRTFNDASGAELADLRLRMQREARAAARIRHPGVIAVHDVAEDDGRPVIVMELVDGPSLADVLDERGVIDPREAAAIGAKVMAALDAGHRVGVLHRDVKPGNILLDRSGRVVLTDFGIASIDDPGDDATSLTRSGQLVGSLAYFAPERARGEAPGPPSDIWSLGATLYAAVEGAAPFRRESAWSTFSAIVTEPLPESRRAGPLAPVLRQLMEKAPQARPGAQRAGELLDTVAAGAAVAGEHGPAAIPPVTTAPPHGVFGPPLYPPVPAPLPVGGDRAETETETVRPSAESGSRRRSRSVLAVAAAVALIAAAGVTAAIMTREPADVAPTAAAGRASRDPGPGRGTATPDTAAASAGSRAGRSPSASPGTPFAAGPEPTRAPSATGRTDSTVTGGGKDNGTTRKDNGSGSAPTPPAATTSTPEPSCQSVSGGIYNCTVWRTADSYDSDWNKVGILDQGTNYFYCQSRFTRRETYGRWTNLWWAKTDDDSGNTGVWVSGVYLRGGANDEPVPGLPTC
jgi:hypothetical protein